MPGPVGAGRHPAQRRRVAPVVAADEAREVQAREHVGARDVQRAGGVELARSSSTAAARSATAIGQRSSSVKKAMSRRPSATSSAIRSCGAGSAPP